MCVFPVKSSAGALRIINFIETYEYTEYVWYKKEMPAESRQTEKKVTFRTYDGRGF